MAERAAHQARAALVHARSAQQGSAWGSVLGLGLGYGQEPTRAQPILAAPLARCGWDMGLELGAPRMPVPQAGVHGALHPYKHGAVQHSPGTRQRTQAQNRLMPSSGACFHTATVQALQFPT